jgi:serine/threonine-protein kinase
VYALGVLAYEVLTHRRPFNGNDYEVVKNAHLFTVADNPTRYRKDLDKRLNKVFAKVLAKELPGRYKTVADFGRAFKAAITSAEEVSEEENVAPVGRESLGRGSRSGAPVAKPDSKKSTKKKEEKTGFLGRIFNRKK